MLGFSAAFRSLLRGLAIALPLAASACAASTPLPKAASLPQSKVLTLQGNATSLSDVSQGRTLVVDLWATWCRACEAQFPKLERLSRAYASHGLVVVGVNVGEEVAVVSEYAARHGIDYPLYLDPDFHFADALGEVRVPAIVVVGPDGQIAHRSERLDEPTLRRIDELLRVQ